MRISDEDEKYLKKELMSEIDTKRVINLAMEAGRMLLKNGGETFSCGRDDDADLS